MSRPAGYPSVKVLVGAVIVLLAGCGQAPTTAASHVSSSPTGSPTLAATFTPWSTPLPTPTSSDVSGVASASRTQPSPPPAPTVTCKSGVIPTYQTLIAGDAGTILYDVSDPLAPHAVCRIANTVAHIVTGTSFEYVVPNPNGTTSIVLHTLGGNTETVRATIKADIYHANGGWFGAPVWLAGHDQIAYLASGGFDANGFDVTDVWLASPSGRLKIYSYAVAGRDAFGRPGFPPPTLGFSADGAYLAAGWTVAQSPVRVFRVADNADVTPALPADFRFGVWSPTGQTLYLMIGGGPVDAGMVESWAPGGTVTRLPGTPSWILQPNFSPGASQVAFTIVTADKQVRAYVYDFATKSSRLLIDQPRSSVLFVRSGWLWEMEEKPCVQSSSNACFDPTQPDGTVLAFDLATGRENRVTFAAGEPAWQYGFSLLDLWPKG